MIIIESNELESSELCVLKGGQLFTINHVKRSLWFDIKHYFLKDCVQDYVTLLLLNVLLTKEGMIEI